MNHWNRRSQRKTRTADILDRDEEISGATALNTTSIGEEEETVAEDISQEVREAMTSLAKEVTSTPTNPEASDTNSDIESEPLKGSPASEEVVNDFVNIAETFVKSVTKFSNTYKNSEAKINKANPKAKNTLGMKAAYNNFLTVYTN